MATSRPTSFLPTWATASFALAISGQQNKVRPTAGHRANGWDENEEPPCNFENYQMNSVYQFLQFFDLNAARGMTAFVCADDATDPMKDMATAEGTGLNKWLCDGTADNIQIQAAIDAVEAAGGGMVLLSEGTFSMLGPLIIDADNVALVGMGRGATSLQLVASATIQFELVTIDTANNCMIADLTIDGNKGNQAGAYEYLGIDLDDATNCVVRDVVVRDLYDDAETEASIRITGASSSYCVIERCHIFGCESDYNIEIIGGADHVVSNCRIVRDVTTDIPSIDCSAASCRIESNRLVGGGILVAAGSTDVEILNNTISGVSGNDSEGIEVTAGSRILIQGNMLKEIEITGMSLAGCSHVQVIGNVIWASGQKTDDNFDNLGIDATCTDVSVTGNICRHGGGGTQPRNGILIGAGTGIWVSGNDFGNSGKTASMSGAANALHPLNSGASALGTEPFQVWKTDAGGSHIPADARMFNRI
jgi:hypothetical protein